MANYEIMLIKKELVQFCETFPGHAINIFETYAGNYPDIDWNHPTKTLKVNK